MITVCLIFAGEIMQIIVVWFYYFFYFSGLIQELTQSMMTMIQI